MLRWRTLPRPEAVSLTKLGGRRRTPAAGRQPALWFMMGSRYPRHHPCPATCAPAPAAAGRLDSPRRARKPRGGADHDRQQAHEAGRKFLFEAW
jgi:hypothetical protein